MEANLNCSFGIRANPFSSHLLFTFNSRVHNDHKLRPNHRSFWCSTVAFNKGDNFEAKSGFSHGFINKARTFEAKFGSSGDSLSKSRTFQAEFVSSIDSINKDNTFEADEPCTISTGDERNRVLEELRKETEAALEWGSICRQLSTFVSTTTGRALCQSSCIPIGRNREESETLLSQTAAAAELIEPLDFSGINDLSEIVGSAVAGELLTIRELCSVEQSLRAARSVFGQLEQVTAVAGSSNRYSSLLSILQDCDFLTELVDKIEYCVDCTLSIVLDRASTKLESIRYERRKNMEKLESLLKGVSTMVFQAGGIDNPLVTKRRSRMCVGVKASHKSLLPDGVVLSSSSSGVTYFVEPRDAIKLNNMEVQLLNEEKAEEFAIIGILTSEIATAEMKIRHLMEKILELDMAVARGAYSLWMGGVCVYFTPDYRTQQSGVTGSSLAVDIRDIQHPLLLEQVLENLSSVSVTNGGISKLFSTTDCEKEYKYFSTQVAPIPIDIIIEYSANVIVVSGPNTGGKTATMKTLGLASLMSKAGIFLPAEGRPKLPWFDQILADIGDHQSLEHNLSTFSGHISRLSKIIAVASKDSLVLIDEIGSGTDPSEGVALSTSILQHLAGQINLAVVTTHYADLTRLKYSDARFENAAMEFCSETLQPTYRIIWGSIGNSNALDIAKSIGFDQQVLDRAEEWVKSLKPDSQKERQGLLYQSLLEEKNLLEAQANEAATVLAEVKKLHSEMQFEAEDLDRRVETLKAKQTKLVQKELMIVKTKIDSVINDFENRLKSSTLDQGAIIMREGEAAISAIVAAVHPVHDLRSEETKNQDGYLPKLGDKVYIKGLRDKVATVVEEPKEDGNAMVQYGKIKMRVKQKDMKLMDSSIRNRTRVPTLQLNRQARRSNIGSPAESNKDEEISFGPVVRTSKNTVDLRGMRVEEASHFLHMAIAGTRSYGVLFVVHGMGSGAVKECTLDILRNHPRVAKFEEESPMNYGCTIAYIK